MPIVAFLFACGEPAETEVPAPEPAPAPAPEPPPAPAPVAATYTLVELQQGDTACYVILKKADGGDANYPGSFELCAGGGQDATGLVGKAVTLDIGKEQIAHESCQGDPECTKTQTVDFVKAITPSP